MHVLNTKPKENSLVYVYFLFWITFKFILLPSAVSFRYYPINDYVLRESKKKLDTPPSADDVIKDFEENNVKA